MDTPNIIVGPSVGVLKKSITHSNFNMQTLSEYILMKEFGFTATTRIKHLNNIKLAMDAFFERTYKTYKYFILTLEIQPNFWLGFAIEQPRFPTLGGYYKYSKTQRCCTFCFKEGELLVVPSSSFNYHENDNITDWAYYTSKDQLYKVFIFFNSRALS